MKGFYGKSYRYKDKVIGTCALGTARMYMIGEYNPETGRIGMCLPLFNSIDEAQKALDEYAVAMGLSEVRA